MAISFVSVGGKITASLINKLIAVVNGTALNGIIPTNVTGGTVTANGAVTFTNSSSVSLDGVFSGSYDNYRITVTSTTRSASSGVNFRLRQGGTDMTTATYDWVRTNSAGTAVTVASSSAGTASPLDQGVAAGQSAWVAMDIFGPALAQTTGASSLTSILASGGLTSLQVSMANETAASSDGFTLYPLAGTWSGTIRVYGYNNLT